jgi:hypothetical protein
VYVTCNDCFRRFFASTSLVDRALSFYIQSQKNREKKWATGKNDTRSIDSFPYRQATNQSCHMWTQKTNQNTVKAKLVMLANE